MLALSSPSLELRDDPKFKPKYDRSFGVCDELESLDSFSWFAESAKDSFVVALDTSRGLLGAKECEVEGREAGSSRFGRGGSGGGVPSLDTAEVSDRAEDDAFLDRVLIMLIVGLAKSCCSTLSFFFGAGAGEFGGLGSVLPEAAERSADGAPVISGASVVIGGIFYMTQTELLGSLVATWRSCRSVGLHS